MEFRISNISDLTTVSAYLIDKMKVCNTFLLYGDLGAGKTTLVKNWMAHLGIKDDVSSPTYSIIQEYTGPTFSVFHMDMYRLKDAQEALEIGIEDYIFDDKNYCIIEWPEIIADLCTSPIISIDIDLLEKPDRMIRIRTDLI